MNGNIFHVLSHAKKIKEPNHHHLSARWWNAYYQIACLSSSDKQFDTFKKMTNHMEQNCSLEDIMEVRVFFNRKIIEAKKKAASVLIDSNNNHSEYISVIIPSSKKRKTHGTKH